MKENIVIKYRHTALFYLLATLIPWIFWFAASYVSHHVVYSESTWTAPLLGLVGLFLSNVSDHYFGFSASGTAKRLSWEIPKLVFR